MNKLIKVFLVFSILTAFISCENLENNLGLSTEEVVEGLKKALEIGADSSTTSLSAVNGYYADEAVKILLPPETDIITTNLNKLASVSPGIEDFMDEQFEKLLLSINRAAEDAADDALPILTDAITDLSIADGWDILNGSVPTSTKSASSEDFDSLAATHYLEQETRDDLVVVFSEPMNASLKKPLVGDVSTYSIWSDVTSTYNTAVDLYNLVPFVNQLETIDTDLGEFVTDKALAGLFLKVGEEEKKIRRNPFEWAVDIIQKVFGSNQ
jgi:hypothetical protein